MDEVLAPTQIQTYAPGSECHLTDTLLQALGDHPSHADRSQARSKPERLRKFAITCKSAGGDSMPIRAAPTLSKESGDVWGSASPSNRQASSPWTDESVGLDARMIYVPRRFVVDPPRVPMDESRDATRLQEMIRGELEV